MMREILFRAKKTGFNEWVQGYVLFKPKNTMCLFREISTNVDWYVDENTIGQYTGLTDKNGKKIFEGDIVKLDNGKRSAVAVVKYGEFEPNLFYDLLEKYVFTNRPKEKICGLFAKTTKGEEMFLSNASKFFEVIGNIHDNPELLKGE